MTIEETQTKDKYGAKQVGIVAATTSDQNSKRTTPYDPDAHLHTLLVMAVQETPNDNNNPTSNDVNHYSTTKQGSPVASTTQPLPMMVDASLVVATAPPLEPEVKKEEAPSGPSIFKIPEGARWIKIKHSGGKTWSLCVVVSVLTCLLVLLPCGVFAFLCPCDEILAYEVNGEVYDEQGRHLGHISKLRLA